MDRAFRDPGGARVAQNSPRIRLPNPGGVVRETQKSPARPHEEDGRGSGAAVELSGPLRGSYCKGVTGGNVRRMSGQAQVIDQGVSPPSTDEDFCPACGHGAEHTEMYRTVKDALRRRPRHPECRFVTHHAEFHDDWDDHCECRDPWHSLHC